MKTLNFTKQLLVALFQIITMVLFYPVLFGMALYLKQSKYGFRCLTKVLVVNIFPGCGKWYLPMLWV